MRLEESYSYCRRVARRRAKNFYYAFRLLDAARRDALCSVYAFMRQCDDLSDEPGASLEVLEAWRQQLHGALAGNTGTHPLWPAFADTATRYRIPTRYFDDMVDGVSSDLVRQRIDTFAELYHYCYQVASVAGLSLIHIFGFDRPDALTLAERCGVAFQLTNILRDVREDALLGRIYLPREDIERFGVHEETFRHGRETEAFRALMRFEAKRARAYFAESAPLVGMVDRACRPSLAALIEIYSRLLDRIEQADYAVLARRIRLPAAEKFWILLRHRWTSY